MPWFAHTLPVMAAKKSVARKASSNGRVLKSSGKKTSIGRARIRRAVKSAARRSA
jgi:hypothetical protein